MTALEDWPPPPYDDRAPKVVKVIDPVVQARNKGNRQRGKRAERLWRDLINDALKDAGLTGWPRAEIRGVLGGADVTWDALASPVLPLPEATVGTQTGDASPVVTARVLHPSSVIEGQSVAALADELGGQSPQGVNGSSGGLQVVGVDAARVATKVIESEVGQTALDQQPSDPVRQRGRVSRRANDPVTLASPSGPLPASVTLDDVRPEHGIAFANNGVDGGASAPAQSVDGTLTERSGRAGAALDATDASKERLLAPTRVMSGAEAASDSLLSASTSHVGIVSGYAFEVKHRHMGWPSNTVIKNALVQAQNNAGTRTPVVVACMTTVNSREWRVYTAVKEYEDGRDWLRKVLA